MGKIVIYAVLAWLFFPLSLMGGQRLVAVKTDRPPVLDGVGNDVAWQAASTITTKDRIADISIELQAVYTDEDLFVKVRFPDATENREHKTLVWSSELELYRTGVKREDSFVLKWSMEPVAVDLSLQSQKPYRADIWYWKAFRTDTMGYADDKQHIYYTHETEHSQQIILPSGKRMFLDRPSDSGKSTYQSITYEKFIGDTAVRYTHRQPSGSRADVRAKGNWSEGYWTIEFQRKMLTGHVDDIQFDPALSYDFGVSRYEISGTPPNFKLEQPYYESGDVGEIITILFMR